MKNQLKTVVLLGVLSAILIGIGGAVRPGLIWVFAGFALLMNVVSYFFSDRIVLAIHHARPIAEHEDPALHRMVAELAQRAGIPRPRVCVIPEETPNAFATGRNPAHGVVAVTVGIRRLLSERELRGVIAHEISHIRNRDILVSTIAAVMATLISAVATSIRWGALFGSRDDRDDGIGALLLAIFAPLAAALLQLAISRSREYLADETGGRVAGDPGALADALERLERGAQRVPARLVRQAPATANMYIVNPLRGGGVMGLFSTHPPMAERVRRLRAQARGR